MTADSLMRLTMLRYLEDRSAGALGEVLVDEPWLDKEARAQICSALDEHHRHAEELDAVLRDAGEQALPVPAAFAREVDERIERIGDGRDKREVAKRVAELERFAVEQYHLAIADSGPESHDLLNAHLLDEQRHAQVLGAKADRLSG